jgi:hypothetical protein
VLIVISLLATLSACSDSSKSEKIGTDTDN